MFIGFGAILIEHITDYAKNRQGLLKKIFPFFKLVGKRKSKAEKPPWGLGEKKPNFSACKDFLLFYK